MKELVSIMKKYAVDLHNKRGYTYGKDENGNDRSYEYHLEMVAGEARKRFHLLRNEEEQVIVECAAYGHDLVEDCGITPNDIIKALGGGHIPFLIAKVINDVSDVPGMNRTERALLTYPKTRTNRLATFVKMCDRYANTFSSKTEGDGMWNGYYVQYPTFRYALKSSNPADQFNPFWEELDELHDYGIERILDRLYTKIKTSVEDVNSIPLSKIKYIFNDFLKN